MRFRQVMSLFLVICVLMAGLCALTESVKAQVPLSAQNLLDRMTPAQKVGQLMLVTFDGVDTSKNSGIYDLITRYHIGGVVLSADNNNFSDHQTIQNLQDMIQALQQAATQKKQPTDKAAKADSLPYIPLFIGIPQSEKPSMVNQILTDVSELPSPMAIGAAWTPTLAAQVGELAGKELSALGFNLYLGPNLDVVDTTDMRTSAYSGTLTFGGDPYWVGKMGRAFIDGLHEGSSGRLAVITTHFPGIGGADRPLNEEVSTVQKSLEQLKQIELSPYLEAVNQTENASPVDGLMVSHIRFQGFQGNIRATTRPVSFDPDALDQLLSVEPLPAWREAGGVMVSDSLGSRAVKYFFDPTGRSFDAQTVTRTAFLAGNDLLYLNGILDTADADSYETTRKVLDYFAQKYEEDSVFANRVDESVKRILTLKLKLYPEFDQNDVLTSPEALEAVGGQNSVAFNVAQEAVTLLHPNADYLRTTLSSPPSTYESIVIFTDTREEAQCAACAPVDNLGVKSFQNALLSLYGPNASRQITESRLFSYSFAQLTQLLDHVSEVADPYVLDNLKSTRWVIFNLDDLDPNVPSSFALQRLLTERSDLISNKNVIVFSYGAPYYLDSTAITKLTAYYALYSKGAGFVELAARILMQESSPRGSLPVSLPLIGYNLNEQTAPNPEQVIPIKLLLPLTVEPDLDAQTEEALTEVTPVPLFMVGETVQIQAGIIRDRNLHLVPDGTVVRFTVRMASDRAIIAQPTATTVDGLATVDYRIDRDGIFEVTAQSEPAMTSGMLILNTQGGLAEVVMPTPTSTLLPTMTPQLSPTPQQTAMPTSSLALSSGYPRMQDWLLIIMILIMGFGVAYLAGNHWWGGVVWGLRSAAATVIGGFVGYILLTLGISSLEGLVKEQGTWFIVQLTVIGMLFGWLGAFIWRLTKTAHKPELNE